MSFDRWIGKETVVYIYTIKYYSALKKGNPAICDNMDEGGGHYAKWNKPDRERQILYGITYMWNPKRKKLIS